MAGIEVLDHDERHSGLFGQGLQEAGEGVQAARGRSDADDGEALSGGAGGGPGGA
jgi:hypothetical protein